MPTPVLVLRSSSLCQALEWSEAPSTGLTTGDGPLRSSQTHAVARVASPEQQQKQQPATTRKNAQYTIHSISKQTDASANVNSSQGERLHVTP